MSTSSYYPSDPYDVSDYDDPDDFAEEWAEEFGDGNYDDGYDDAYDYWESEYSFFAINYLSFLQYSLNNFIVHGKVIFLYNNRRAPA